MNVFPTMFLKTGLQLHSENVLTIDASNLYCKITLVWLDSSLSVQDIGNNKYYYHNTKMDAYYWLH